MRSGNSPLCYRAMTMLTHGPLGAPLLGFLLRRCDVLLHRQEAVGTDRHGVNAAGDQKPGELGMVAWRLPAESYLGAGRMRLLDDVADHPENSLVLLVEEL